MTIYTIGHSSRSLEELLEILGAWKIELLVDVRSLPGSRKFPQFNRESLEAALPEKGVEYLHLKGLGGLRKKLVETSLNQAWENTAFRNYADYMQTEEFQEGLSALLAAAEVKRTAIMCAEAVPWRCHRQLISDAVVALRRVDVFHILTAAKGQDHKLTSFSKVQEGRVIYP
ncbi:MAG: DUF488 domain-containing protein [Acidobacteria bacterium]|nr:MAG: DUF488 domain-containing protein [Acidobacteriota bacterium]